MSTTEKHTPTPWRACDYSPLNINGVESEGIVKEITVATVHNTKNRQLIINAVNNYAPMVEALENALKYVREGADMLQDTEATDIKKEFHKCAKQITEVLKSAKQ
jgi:hypothetical protein